MPSRKMRTAIYLFCGLDVEIRPIWTPPELFIHLGGAIGMTSAPRFPPPSGFSVVVSGFSLPPARRMHQTRKRKCISIAATSGGRRTKNTNTYCPTKVDKQLGRVHFRPNLNIQPIKKINGGPHLSARHEKSRLNLI